MNSDPASFLPETFFRAVRDGICDRCNGALVQREDDQPEAIRQRLEVYQKSTRPLEDYYGKKGLLINIEANGSPREVFEKTKASINEVIASGSEGISD